MSFYTSRMVHLGKFRVYNVVVILLYVVLLPLVVIFAHPSLRHDLPSSQIGVVGVITAISLAAFFLLLPYIRPGNVTWRSKTALVAFFAGFIFAIPEEILFRGIIQGYLQQHVHVLIAILIAAVVFGGAHFLNGARGIRPQEWNWKFITTATLAGIPLGTLFAITGSLLPSTLLHAFFVFYLQLKPNPRI